MRSASSPQRKTTAASIVAELPGSDGPEPADLAADIALGALLRSYKFDKYLTKAKTEKPEGENGDDARSRRHPAAGDPHRRSRRRARRHSQRREALAGGIADGPRSRQRAGQRAGAGRVRRALPGADAASACRSRSSISQPVEGARHGRADRRRAGQRARAARRRDAVERRQVEARQAAGLHRQGRDVRHRRLSRSSRPPAWRT